VVAQIRRLKRSRYESLSQCTGSHVGCLKIKPQRTGRSLYQSYRGNLGRQTRHDTRSQTISAIWTSPHFKVAPLLLCAPCWQSSACVDKVAPLLLCAPCWQSSASTTVRAVLTKQRLYYCAHRVDKAAPLLLCTPCWQSSGSTTVPAVLTKQVLVASQGS
jgi:hypothetical protein